jgi:hypothetical protein
MNGDTAGVNKYVGIALGLAACVLVIAGVSVLKDGGDVDQVEMAMVAPPGTGLSGARRHSFGIVELVATGKNLDHTFVLSNTSQIPIRIGEITTTCGCLKAVPDKEIIKSGDELHLDSTLVLSDSGTKSVQIDCICQSHSSS